MSPLTLSELQEKLARLDPDTLVELLRISSSELVEYFKDKIEDNLTTLERSIDDYE